MNELIDVSRARVAVKTSSCLVDQFAFRPPHLSGRREVSGRSLKLRTHSFAVTLAGHDPFPPSPPVRPARVRAGLACLGNGSHADAGIAWRNP